MNIFVSKLSGKTTSDKLKALFEQFGQVTSARIIMDKETGESKRYGFVEMVDKAAANEAIKALNESEFDERTIIVKEAQEREKR